MSRAARQASAAHDELVDQPEVLCASFFSFPVRQVGYWESARGDRANVLWDSSTLILPLDFPVGKAHITVHFPLLKSHATFSIPQVRVRFSAELGTYIAPAPTKLQRLPFVSIRKGEALTRVGWRMLSGGRNELLSSPAVVSDTVVRLASGPLPLIPARHRSSFRDGCMLRLKCDTTSGDCGSVYYSQRGVVGVHVGGSYDAAGRPVCNYALYPHGHRVSTGRKPNYAPEAGGVLAEAYFVRESNRAQRPFSSPERRIAQTSPLRSAPSKPAQRAATTSSKPSAEREASAAKSKSVSERKAADMVAESIFTAPASGSDLLTARAAPAVASLDSYVSMVVNPWAGAPVRLPDVNITPTAIGKFYANRTYKFATAAPETILFGMSSRLGKASEYPLYDLSTQTTYEDQTLTLAAGNISYSVGVGGGGLAPNAISRQLVLNNVQIGVGVFTAVISGLANASTNYPVFSGTSPADYGPTLVAPMQGYVGGVHATCGLAGQTLWDALGLQAGSDYIFVQGNSTNSGALNYVNIKPGADRQVNVRVTASSGVYKYSPGCILTPQQVATDGTMTNAINSITPGPGPWFDDYGVEQSTTSSWVSAYRTLAMAMRFRVIGLPDSAFLAPGKLYVAQVRADCEDFPTTEQDFVVLERMGRASHVSLDAVREAGSKTFFAVPDSADKFNFTSSFAMSPGVFSTRNGPDTGAAGDSGTRIFPGYSDQAWILANTPGDASRLVVPYDGRPVTAGGNSYPGSPTTFGIAATMDAPNADQTTILVAGMFGAYTNGGTPTLEVDYASVVEYIPSSRAPPGIDTRVQLPNSQLNDQIFSACAAFAAIRPAMFQMAGDATTKGGRSSISSERSRRLILEIARRGAGQLARTRTEGLLDWLIGYDNVSGNFDGFGFKAGLNMQRR